MSISAQEFTSLKWQSTFDAHRLSFSEAHFLSNSTLPYYIQNFDLGSDYADNVYDVKIEYPEFENLNKSESLFLSQNKEILSEFPQPKTRIVVSAQKGILEVSFVPIVFRDGTYQRLNSFKLSLVKSVSHQKRAIAKATNYVENSRMAVGRWVKIRVKDTGVYKITNAELLKMGFTNPAKVKLYGYGGYLLSEKFDRTKVDDLPQIPLWREASFVLFYANGVTKWNLVNNQATFTHTNNYYSTYGYYFLVEDDEAPKNFPVVKSLNASNAMQVNSFDDYAIYEKDSYNWTTSGRELYDSYDYIAGNKKDYLFNLPGITSDRATCKVAFASASATTTNVAVSINSKDCGRFLIDALISSDLYSKGQVGYGSFNWEGDKTEKTTVSLTHLRDIGVTGRLDYIELNYKRALSLYGSSISFRNIASINTLSTYTISGANERLKVWDVTTPDTYSQIEGSLAGNKYSFTANAPSLREYVALNVDGTFNSVEVLGTVPNQNLHALKQCDMVIIIPSNGAFVEQAERLAEAHRVKDKMVVHVVTADQVYNEFSSGTPDVTAYRWFMKMFYDRALPTTVMQANPENRLPKYLLLFGDCAWDNRMITPAWKGYDPNDFLLCYQSKNSTWETYSYVTDDYVGLLDDQDGANPEYDGMDIGVGRFPVRSLEQATQVVDKTIAYMQNKEMGSWKNTICYVADDGDNHLHMSQAEEVASYTEKNNPDFVVNRIFLDAYKRESTATGYTYMQANKKLMELFNEGMLMLNYSGHGGPSGWSAEAVLTTPNILSLSSPRLPLWVTATCDFCRYDDVPTSGGELAFLNPKGGAVALFTTSRVVYAQNNSSLNKVFCKNVFRKIDGKRLRLGDIMRLSKCDASLSGDVNKLKFSLIGDPALMLAYPDYKIVVDEFDGKPSSSNDLAIKAGAKVQVKGHITDVSGNLLSDFNGKVFPTVFDARESVTTLNNDGTGKIVNPNNPKDVISGGFTFTQRAKKLFSGSESVKSGAFTFTFPVPKDISYSNAGGLLNFYASETTLGREAQGAFDHFLIGGTEPGTENTDGNGPKINLYLNTPEFIYGGKTNQTPYLVAELEDVDGINTVGNGVGHDIVAMIDNSPSCSFVLNNYYESVFGDYTKGVVRYQLPALAEGKHTLFFRAWDVQNNSSFTTLDFEVVSGLKPNLFNIECTKSPAKESTTFVLSHDRPLDKLDVTVQVYDFSGRVLWTRKESGVSQNNYYYINWDLTSNGGQRIEPGVYLFRASISSKDSEESTQAKKIVVLAQ